MKINMTWLIRGAFVVFAGQNGQTVFRNMLIQANKKTIKSLVGVSRPLKQMCVMISSLQDYQRQCRDLYPSSPSSHIYF